MRLLVFTSSYGHIIGGGPVLAPLLMDGLVARGHEVTVLVDQVDGLADREESNGVFIVRMPFRQALTGDFSIFSRIRDEIIEMKQHANAVYIFSNGRGDVFHHMTNRRVPRPSMVTLHDLYPEEQFHPDAMVGRNLREAARITTCSQAALDWTCRYLPEIRTRSLAVANAVPTPEIEPQEPCRTRLLFAGRLVRHKGCDLAIGALARLASDFPSIVLDIAGDGLERETLTSEAARLGISDRVNFLGGLHRDSLIERMATSAMLLVPSRDEPFGLVALEAAHAGRPVIAAAVGGLGEVVLHDATGLVVPPDNIKALAEAIAQLLRDPDKADRLGAQGRARARADFDFEDFTDTYERLLLEVAG